MEPRLLVDRESKVEERRFIGVIPFKNLKARTLQQAVANYNKVAANLQLVVAFVDSNTGETIKGPKYDTTTLPPVEDELQSLMEPGVEVKEPIEPSQHEPRDRFQENSNMKNEANKLRSLIRECISEINVENNPRLRLKEALRPIVKNALKEISTNGTPEPDKDEKETISKGYKKTGNERLDKTNEKLLKELESLVHGIDANWEVYWDDHAQLIVRAQNLLYVRICPQFENKFNVDAMVKLVDRVRAIALDWEQVKAFVKANFSDLKKGTNADRLTKKSVDNETDDREVIKKDAGPRSDIVKNRGEKKNGEDAKIKDAKRDDKDYNEPMTKREEDMPDKPMKQVTEPGKDPEGKNHDIKKTDKVKPPKHKNDKVLRISDKKTSKFTKKQVNP